MPKAPCSISSRTRARICSSCAGDVLTRLRETLIYQNYELATTVFQRLTDTSRGLRGKGTTEISQSPPRSNMLLPYEYLVNSITLVSTSTGAPIIQIGEFSFATDRSASIMDPAGHVWTVASRIEETTSQVRTDRWSGILAGKQDS